MDKQTYEALKLVVSYCHSTTDAEGVLANELRQLEGWISEVAKDYEGEDATE